MNPRMMNPWTVTARTQRTTGRTRSHRERGTAAQRAGTSWWETIPTASRASDGITTLYGLLVLAFRSPRHRVSAPEADGANHRTELLVDRVDIRATDAR